MKSTTGTSISLRHILASLLIVIVFASIISIQPVSARAPGIHIRGGVYTTPGSTPQAFASGSTIPIPPNTSVGFDYVGWDDNDRLLRFECKWDTQQFASANCPTMTSNRFGMIPTQYGAPETGNVNYITGNVFRTDLTVGSHIFYVRVLNDDWNGNSDYTNTTITTAPRSFQFTISRPTTSVGTVDFSLTPTAKIYKANSYNVYATTYIPPNINNQYHTGNDQTTPYNKMYIVFEAEYGGNSDIFATNGRTTFECKWDSEQNWGSCGRFNFVQNLDSGTHSVQFRAINPGMIRSQPAQFTWCVSGCINYFDFRPISRSLDVTSYISTSPDVSFYPGKNDTITLEDLKKFPLLNVTTGATNETIFLEDLKQFPFGNKTIGATNETIFEKEMKENEIQNITSGTNNTNTTSSLLEDNQITGSSNATLVKGK